MTCKEYREKSWKMLAGKWSLLVVMALIETVIVGAVSAIPFVGWIGGIVLTGPFILGLTYVTFKVLDNKEFEFMNLFDGFKNFVKSFLLGLINTVLVALWSILLVVPGIIKSISYSMSFFILAENPNMDPNEARLQSMQMMEGHKWDYFKLQFSFIGWILLTILTFGILGFWVEPYMMTTSANFYRDLKAGKAVIEPAKKVETVNE